MWVILIVGVVLMIGVLVGWMVVLIMSVFFRGK